MKFAILGPTASGKSSLALEVARCIGGTVANGDPFQSIEGIPIGTGQPSISEQRGVTHIGYGCLPLTAPMNPADFGARVRGWMAGLDRVVLVTGSGLYLRGIWEQLDELPEVPGEIVAQVRRWHAVVGAPRLHRYLCSVDPVRAAVLHPNDGSRIQRALALHLATGKRPSTFFTGTKRGVPEGWKALLVMPTRDHQRERIEWRVRAMVEQGWQSEALGIAERGQADDLRRLKPLGYADWLNGGNAKAIEARIVIETQAYAKRQSTWFRNQLPGVPTWDPDKATLEEVFGKLGIYFPNAPVDITAIMPTKNRP
jgi:tRNA dimethylallyltransferase